MPTTVIKTIKASGGDYLSLSAWESGEQRDLVAADEIAVAECYDEWPSGLADAVAVAGWTSDSTRYPVIRAASGHAGNGRVPDGTGWSGFFLKDTVNSALVELGQQFAQLEGIGLFNESGLAQMSTVYFTAEDALVRRCASRHSSTRRGFRVGGVDRYRIEFCDAYADTGGDAFGLSTASTAGVKVHNCKAINLSGSGGNGFRNATTARELEIRNCVAYGFDTSYSDGWSVDSSNNAADDASTNTPPGSDPLTTDVTSSDWADAANDDYHLSSGSILRDAGANLTGIVTEAIDIDGDALPGTGAWDIGADYFVTAGTPTISPTGIASAAAFGDLDLSPGAVALSPNGLASAEAHGNATVQSGVITLSPSAVASAEAHGDATVSPGAVTLSPASIASAEAHGSPTMGLSILANAIASAAVFGAVAVSAGAATLSPDGLASAAAFGNPTASPGTVTLEPAGLASAEAHGAHTVSISGVAQSVDLADGISSAEAHGTITLDGGADFALFEEVTETSFSSAATSHLVQMPATVDADDLLLILIATYEPSSQTTSQTTPSGWTELFKRAEDFSPGRRIVAAYAKDADGTEGGTTVDVATSANTTGSAHVYRFSRWSGRVIDVQHAVDTVGGSTQADPPQLSTGVEADWVWIAGAASFNDDDPPDTWPTGYTDDPYSTACGAGVDASGRISSSRRALRAQSEDPGQITWTASEHVISFTLAVPPRPTGTLSPEAIPSSELFGTAITGRTIDAAAIASAAAFGTHDVIPGGFSLSPSAIDSAEAHGTPAFLPGTTTLDMIGLPSDATFGQALLLGGAGLGYLLGEIDVYAAVSGRVDVEAALAGDAEVVVSLDARVRLDG